MSNDGIPDADSYLRPLRIDPSVRGQSNPSAQDFSSEIRVLTVQDGVLVENSADQCDELPQIQTLNSGGPGDLAPGHWVSDAQPRQGWRFFWANELRFDSINDQFGVAYDLLGVWYTYRMIDGDWSPVWYYARLVEHVGDGTPNSHYFEGALHFPQQGSRDQKVGTVRVLIDGSSSTQSMGPNVLSGEPNQTAILEIDDLNAGEGNNGSISIPIYDLAVSPNINQFDGENSSSRWNGIWAPGSLFNIDGQNQGDRFFIAEWISGCGFSSALNTFDTDGNPIWFIDFGVEPTCSPGSGTYPDFSDLRIQENMVVPFPGFNPLWDATGFEFPDGYQDDITVPVLGPPPVGGGARPPGVFGRKFSGIPTANSEEEHLRARFCASLYPDPLGGRQFDPIVVNASQCHATGQLLTGGELSKKASLHHIGIEYSQGDSCTLVDGSCGLKLTWFTDGDFPDAFPVVRERVDNANGPQWERHPLTNYCSNPIQVHTDTYAAYDEACTWTKEGVFQLLLVVEEDAGEPIDDHFVLARSPQFWVDSSANTPPVNPESTRSPASFASFPWDSLIPEHQPIGAIPGDFEVTESGAASYRIPIKVAKGRGDFAPQIALSFSSQSGQGYAGEQWSIAGIPSISRCGQTIAQDGMSTAVVLDNASDRFCLDGQRLVLKDGSAYGASGTEYRLEQNNHTRVYFFDRAGEHSHFVVQRKDGTTEFYGPVPEFVDTASARIAASGVSAGNPAEVALAWPISRREDSAGNFFTFKYGAVPDLSADLANCAIQGAIEWVPTELLFTGNGALDPHSSLVFDWEPASICSSAEDVEASAGWIAGQRIQQTSRLSAIRSLDGADEIRRYDLRYSTVQAAGRFDFLDQVKECWGADPANDCFASPTSFVWSLSDLQTGSIRTASGFINAYRGAQVGDIDGDGRDEIAVIEKLDGCANGIGDDCPAFAYYDSDFDGATASLQKTISATLDDDEGFDIDDVSRFGWTLADLEGDGRMGLLFGLKRSSGEGGFCGLDGGTCPQSAPYVEILYKPYAGASPQGQFSDETVFIGVIEKIENDFDPRFDALSISVSDLDGDGLSDVMATRSAEGDITFGNHLGWFWKNESSRSGVSPNWGSPSPIVNTGFIEVDLDVCPDYGGQPVAPFYRSRAEIQSGGFSLDRSSRTALITEVYVYEYCPLNGTSAAPRAGWNAFSETEIDALVAAGDVLLMEVYNKSGAYFFDFSGPSFELAGQLETSVGKEEARLAPLDFNSDGLTDVLRITKEGSDDVQLDLFINTGSRDVDSAFVLAPGFPVQHPLKFEKRGLISPTDVTGDGRPDLLIPEGTSGRSAIEVYSWPWISSTGQFQPDPNPIIPNGLTVDDEAENYKEQLLVFDADGNGIRDFAVLGEYPEFLGDAGIKWVEAAGTVLDRFEQNYSLAEIVDGLGATTKISYLPTSSNLVYRRDTGDSPWMASVGAPIYEMIGSNYVVSSVSSSMPQAEPVPQVPVSSTFDSSGTVEVQYYYTGAKIQGHGRGPLGFRQVASFSPDTRIVTVTEYDQVFPAIGHPISTGKFYLPEGAEPWPRALTFGALPECDASPCDQEFFGTEGGNWQTPAGAIILSESWTTWEAYWGESGSSFASGYVHVHRDEVFESSYQPFGAGLNGFSSRDLIKSTRTEFLPLSSDPGGASIDRFGNVQKLRVTTYEEQGVGGQEAASQETVSAYAASSPWIVENDPASIANLSDLGAWRLGRLTCSLVRHSRPQGQAIRASTFAYDLDTGRLNKENSGFDLDGPLPDSWCSTSPSSSEAAVSKVYSRDLFGNVIEVVTSYAENTSAPGTKRNRGSRTLFGTSGRYLESEWVLQGADPTQAGNWGLVKTIAETARSRYGDPMEVVDQHGNSTVSNYSTSGRLRAVGSPTGEIVVQSVVAGHALCPAGTAYAELSASASGARSVICFDLIGREIRSATRGFAPLEANAPWGFVDTFYDYQSRPVAVSEPYYDDAVGQNDWQCAQNYLDLSCGAPHFTISYFDEIGRVRRLDQPVFDRFGDGTARNHKTQLVQYGYQDNPLTKQSFDAVGLDTFEATNVLGEKTSERAENDAQTTFTYDHLGRLTSVDGPIAGPTDRISIEFDHLGNKIEMQDPDKGHWYYRYNALGELVCQVDAEENATVNHYDDLGRLVEQKVFNLGSAPPLDADGRLDCWDPTMAVAGVSTSVWEFDPYASNSGGRSGVSGLLEREISTQPASWSSIDAVQEISFSRDSFGRVTTVSTLISEPAASGPSYTFSYSESTHFDEFGRVLAQFDASGGFRGDLFRYADTGHVSKVHDARYQLDESPVRVEFLLAGARGRTLQAELGNGIVLEREYDPATSEVLIRADRVPNGAAADTFAVYLDHQWDDIGNLIFRADLASSGIPNYEFYGYDQGTKRRLTDVVHSSIDLPPTYPLSASSSDYSIRQLIEYDLVGNISCKSDLAGAVPGSSVCQDTGKYEYMHPQPHAVSHTGEPGTATERSYFYDLNGNLTSRQGSAGIEQEIRYTQFNKPETICVGACNSGSSTSFVYGASRARFIKRVEEGGQVRRTHYVGSVEFEYLGDPNGNAATPLSNVSLDVARREVAGVALGLVDRFAGQLIDTTRYRHTDHQGSLLAFSDINGNVIAEMRFSAFGERRASAGIDSPVWRGWIDPNRPVWADSMLEVTPRGFTGHEHLDTHGLIHMNGRIYDPHVGRFLQADSYIEDVVTLNRYTYVHNNPMRFTDPSGHFGLDEFVTTAMAVMISTATAQTINATYAYAALNASMTTAQATAISASVATVSGAVVGTFQTGTWKGAKIGAFTGLASFGIGQGLDSFAWASKGGKLTTAGYAAKIVSHGVVGGIASDLGGGQFGHGFISSAASSAAAPHVDQNLNFDLAGVTVSALIGGTISEISGGDFANGAITSSIQFGVNQLTKEKAASLTVDVETLVGHPGESFSGFSDRANRRILELTQQSRHEHRFVFAEREVEIYGFKFTQYAARIQTSGAHVWSYVTKVADGFTPMRDQSGHLLDVHSHGIDEGQRPNDADLLFRPDLAPSNSRVRPRLPRQRRFEFSEHDGPGGLATANGIIWQRIDHPEIHQQ